MRAGLLWMLMVCLSDGKKPRCSVGPTITVSELSEVSVSCPSVSAKSSELQYELLFKDSSITQMYLNQLSPSAESLFFGHFQVTANSSGEYVCKRKVIYPPPFSEDCITTAVIVAEKQPLPAINETSAAYQSCPVRTPFIPDEVMWAGCGVLLIYSLSITCVTIVIWRKKKTRDKEDANVYVNSRPGERKKKKRNEDDTNVYVNTRPGEIRKPSKV